MKPHSRLNQLSLADDTRFGLALISLTLLVQAFHGVHLGGAFITASFGLEVTFENYGWVQVSMLLSLAFAIALARLTLLKRRVKPVEADLIDQSLAKHATEVARQFAGPKPQFQVTSRLDDPNAFCLPGYPRPSIVLGGGLRLLLRRAKDEASSIIAHECVHISKRDTVFLISSWYLWLAYTLLATTNFGVLSILFLSDFDRDPKIGYWDAAGFTSLTLFDALIVGFVLRHFINQREYVADEGTAQRGLRNSILTCLNRFSRHARGKRQWILPRLFHPSLEARIGRVKMGRGWDRLDPLFCVGVAVITFRFNVAMQLGTVSVSLVAIVLLHILFFSFVVPHHIYRVVLTKLASGTQSSGIAVIGTAGTAILVSMLGAGFAITTHAMFLNVATSVMRDGEAIFTVFDSNFAAPILTSLALVTPLVFGGAFSAWVAAQRKAIGGLRGVLVFVFGCVELGLLAHLCIGVIVFVLGSIDPLEVAGLVVANPESIWLMRMGDAPSVLSFVCLQLLVILVLTVSTSILGAVFPAKVTARVHPSRLISV